jgi:hypothetical protein
MSVVRDHQFKAFSTSRGGVYPRPLLFRRVGSNEALQNIKFQAPNYKQISNSNIEAPCSKQQGIFEM